MPGGDRTGPLGRGPMTGRAAGYCSGYQMPGYERGFGVGRGRGRGFGRGFWKRGRSFWLRDYYPETYYKPVQSRVEEKNYLENTIKELEEEIKSIRERIKDLSIDKKENP